ncbi:zinc finger, C2H2 type [Necator americanus]|uniref:Zinc finger, C2H2 type n=1 Tax=Necator americanus TaxID=51031 RepID=W2TCN8_NECAM|nr:zinc finger, C2H2 type [Necator americanus]ETN78961.1 zinc finger, C2H2 type [Necator americanus]
MSYDLPTKAAFFSDELRAVLDFFGVRLDVAYAGNRFFEVTLQFRLGNERIGIVMLSHISSYGDDRFPRGAAKGVNRSRVIPLPYTANHGSDVNTPKRRRTTVASLLGEAEYFVCKQCFKSFNRRSNMTRHMDRIHCERVVFNCPYCPAVYKHAFHFADHLRSHEDDPQFACESCEKKFTSRNQLRAHKRRNCLEPPPKKHPCVSRRRAKYDPQPDACSSDAGWKMDSVQQFSRSDFNNTFAHVLSSGNNSLMGMSLTGALPLETFPSISNGCPVECLTTLTAYKDNKLNTVVMLRPADVNVFTGYTSMNVDSLVCATSAGNCGAIVPLFLHYSGINQDYYIGWQPEAQSPYSVQYSGNPLCYLWLNSSYVTALNTTISSIILNSTANFNASVSTTPNPSSQNLTTTGFSPTTTSQPITVNTTTTLLNGEKKKRSTSNFWPLVLAGVVGLGVLVITILALSTLSIIRSGRRAIRPQKTSNSPPPPYPYTQDTSSDLPPAPVSSMPAPQPLSVNAAADLPLAPSGYT